MNDKVTIVRKHPIHPVGIDKYLNGYDLINQQTLKRAVYHGGLVYLWRGKQLGLPSIKKNRVNIELDFSLPF